MKTPLRLALVFGALAPLFVLPAVQAQTPDTPVYQPLPVALPRATAPPAPETPSRGTLFPRLQALLKEKPRRQAEINALLKQLETARAQEKTPATQWLPLLSYGNQSVGPRHPLFTPEDQAKVKTRNLLFTEEDRARAKFRLLQHPDNTPVKGGH